MNFLRKHKMLAHLNLKHLIKLLLVLQVLDKDRELEEVMDLLMLIVELEVKLSERSQELLAQEDLDPKMDLKLPITW